MAPLAVKSTAYLEFQLFGRKTPNLFLTFWGSIFPNFSWETQVSHGLKDLWCSPLEKCAKHAPHVRFQETDINSIQHSTFNINTGSEVIFSSLSRIPTRKPTQRQQKLRMSFLKFRWLADDFSDDSLNLRLCIYLPRKHRMPVTGMKFWIEIP